MEQKSDRARKIFGSTAVCCQAESEGEKCKKDNTQAKVIPIAIHQVVRATCGDSGYHSDEHSRPFGLERAKTAENADQPKSEGNDEAKKRERARLGGKLKIALMGEMRRLGQPRFGAVIAERSNPDTLRVFCDDVDRSRPKELSKSRRLLLGRARVNQAI